MIKGVFNSIVFAGRLAHRVVASLGRQLLIKFNAVAKDVKDAASEVQAAVSSARDTLRGRFNNCNDRLSFSGNNEAKAARVQALIDMLRDIAARVAEGTASALEAMGIVCELETLGIHVSGLPLYAPGAPLDHKKIAYARHVHRRPAFAA